MKNPEKKEELERNLLTEGPELVPSEREMPEKNWSFSFSSDSHQYLVGHKNGIPFFQVEYKESLPDELSDEEKQGFSRRKKKDFPGTVFVLRHGPVPEGEEGICESGSDKKAPYRIAEIRDFRRGMNERFVADEKNRMVLEDILKRHSGLGAEEIRRLVDQMFEGIKGQDGKQEREFTKLFSNEIAEAIRRDLREEMLPNPETIDISRLVEMIKTKKVLFYTGAGISVASGIYDMSQLHAALKIDMSEDVDGFLKNAVRDPKSLIGSWEEFANSMVEKPATSAHRALAEMALRGNIQVFTENFDFLQEKTGIKPVHLNGSWIKENVRPEQLTAVDVIITVGLSQDDRGFLGWYKQHNPGGKIVAINIEQPPYLGDEDFLLKGDCQIVIPKLLEEFV